MEVASCAGITVHTKGTCPTICQRHGLFHTATMPLLLMLPELIDIFDQTVHKHPSFSPLLMTNLDHWGKRNFFISSEDSWQVLESDVCGS